MPKTEHANFANRTVWTGDNLDILRGMNSESVDLIYLEPIQHIRYDNGMATRTCALQGCGRPHVARGMCAKHYQRWSKHGDPRAPVGRRPYNMTSDDLISWISKQMVEGQDGCLFVPSIGTNSKGRPSIYIRGKLQLVHRWLYEQRHGPVPEHRYCAHRCLNKKCVNTDHLYLASASENAHGEPEAGIRAHGQSFTWEQVRLFRDEFASNEESVKALANRESVSIATMSLLLRGRTYKEAGGPIWAGRRTDVRI